ncbi:hypothetical protein [Paracoccus sp. (in: a-proteobacteria)]
MARFSGRDTLQDLAHGEQEDHQCRFLRRNDQQAPPAAMVISPSMVNG